MVGLKQVSLVSIHFIKVNLDFNIISKKILFYIIYLQTNLILNLHPKVKLLIHFGVKNIKCKPGNQNTEPIPVGRLFTKKETSKPLPKIITWYRKNQNSDPRCPCCERFLNKDNVHVWDILNPIKMEEKQ